MLWRKHAVNNKLQTTLCPCLLTFHFWKKRSDMSTPRVNTTKKYIYPFSLCYQLYRFLDIMFLRSLFYRAKEPHVFQKVFSMCPTEAGVSVPRRVSFGGWILISVTVTCMAGSSVCSALCLQLRVFMGKTLANATVPASSRSMQVDKCIFWAPLYLSFT